MHETTDSGELFQKVFEAAPIGIVLVCPNFVFEKANPTFCRMLGYTQVELQSMTFADITHPEHRAPDVESVGKVMRGELPYYQTEKRYMHKNGEVMWGRVMVSGVWDETDGALRHFLVLIENVTARRRAEEENAKLQAQLQQAQKLETVGRLAGGVAHEFNNMLSIILGYAELVKEQVDPATDIHASLEEIVRAAEYSAKITRQLLAFARKQIISLKVMNFNDVMAGVRKPLEQPMGERITLDWRPSGELWPIKADPAQIEQILVNLCINARDAISGSGRITITTGNKVFSAEESADHPDYKTGDFAWLAVSDDGCGMPREMLAHIFEPFYTNKRFGKGSGLGLAMIYGAVQQNKGFVTIESEPGRGTCVTIYLPRYVDEQERSFPA